MLTFENYGEPLSLQKIVPGNTATAFSKYCYEYTRWRLDFDDADTQLTVGSWIVGATSGAVGKLVSVHPDLPESWTNETGYVILDSWNGTEFQDNEEIKQASASTAANVNGLLKPIHADYHHKGDLAKTCLILILSNTALIDIMGATPDQTQLNGISLPANSTMLIKDINAIRNFKCIDYTAGSASTVQALFYF